MSTLLRQLKGESQRQTNMASHGLGKLLGSAADKIAELEKKLSNAETMGDREQSIHNLEQQAKGVEWVLACRELNLSEGEVHTLMDKCNQLRNQAKALKEREL